jgi:DNA-binding response OmpR family regulator
MMSGCDLNLGFMNNVSADDYMQKPFDYNDLLSRIDNQMQLIAA